MVVTPRVQDEVRKHFGCGELEGAELENQGGEGTALTHWEKRLFEVNFYSIEYLNIFGQEEFIFASIEPKS